MCYAHACSKRVPARTLGENTTLKFGVSGGNGVFVLALALLAWYCPFWSGFGLFDHHYKLKKKCNKDVICVLLSNCKHGLQKSL